jgi:outer membrane lipoprotein-sorting protein
MNNQSLFRRSSQPLKILDTKLNLFMSIAVLSAATTVWAQSTAEVFSRLDRAAPSFKAATATIRVTTHTGVINEDETQEGTVAVKRFGRNELRFLINFTGESAQAVALKGNKIEIYYPITKTIRVYDIGKYKDIAQKLALLGFGTPGRELAANYEVSNLGDERVESQDSIHLELTPKAADLLKQLTKVDLWISVKNNCPVQQKFHFPGGDYRLVTYSNVSVNPDLGASALDLPKHAK